MLPNVSRNVRLLTPTIIKIGQGPNYQNLNTLAYTARIFHARVGRTVGTFSDILTVSIATFTLETPKSQGKNVLPSCSESS